MTRLWSALPSLLAGAFVALGAVTIAEAQPTDATAETTVPTPALRRFALVVGANDGGHDRVVLRYAGSDAAALGAVLERFGGVSGHDRTTLTDPDPAALEEAFATLSERIEAARADGQHVQFIFYYSGHSDEQGLLLGGDRVSYKQLRQRVQKVPADVRIAVLDSCASGAFTRAKGGKKRAPFLVSNTTDVKGHAFLTSSSIDEAAQESDRIGGSFFTHYFTTGLRGAADVDGDRLITLSEAYQFAFDETLARTETTRGGAQHAAYDIQLAGSGDLVMTDLRETTARIELSSAIGGRISVRNDAGKLAAELYKPPGSGTVALALEPGHYQVRVDDGQDLWRGELTLRPDGVAALEPDALTKVDRESTVQRGDTAPPTDPEAEFTTIPVNVGVFPPLSLNGQDQSGKKLRNKVSFALGWSRVDQLDGAALAGGASVVRGAMNGAQLSTVGNLAGQVDGAQLSMFFNHASSVAGFQSSMVNYAETVEPGVQMGLVDIVGTMRGLQLGLVNVGKDVKGAQVGLLNFAGRTDAGVGLVSVTREGNVHPEITLSDDAAIGVALRLPATYTYSFIEGAIHPAGTGQSWRVGAGFGGHVPLQHKMFVDIDLGWHAVFRGLSTPTTPDPLGKLRFMVGWSPYSRLTVFGGPTVNVLVDRGTTELLSRPGFYQWGPQVYRSTVDEVRVRVWPGFVMGLRF
ncbi:MAG: caspase family protein [Myxococcota bacterium]